MTDFSPSAVQSDTIQPHSTVLKGKAPCAYVHTRSLQVIKYNRIPHLVRVAIVFLVLWRVVRNLRRKYRMMWMIKVHFRLNCVESLINELRVEKNVLGFLTVDV